MDREASMKGTASPGFAGAERCGGVMVRGPRFGNGTCSSVYYLDSAGLVPPRSRALYGQTDPPAAGMRAEGSLAAALGLGGSRQCVGGLRLGVPVAASGVSLTGLGGAVTFDSISALHVPPGGATGQITVTVIWKLLEPPGSNTSGNPEMTTTLKMTYGMSVIDLQSDKWYVRRLERLLRRLVPDDQDRAW